MQLTEGDIEDILYETDHDYAGSHSVAEVRALQAHAIAERQAERVVWEDDDAMIWHTELAEGKVTAVILADGQMFRIASGFEGNKGQRVHVYAVEHDREEGDGS